MEFSDNESYLAYADSLPGASKVERIRRFARLWRKYAGQCWVCRETVNLYCKDDKTRASVEHIVPESIGGTREDYNAAISHRRCNEQRKAPVLPVKPKGVPREEFIQALSRNLRAAWYLGKNV